MQNEKRISEAVSMRKECEKIIHSADLRQLRLIWLVAKEIVKRG